MSWDFAEQLQSQGMSVVEAERKAALFAHAAHAVPAADWAAFVPGRVELLGKHTDYAGGRSLLCAVERGFCFLARARPDDHLHITDVGRGSRILLALRSTTAPPPGEWAVYPAAVARRLARDFGITVGIDLAFASDLPPAAGLSSSSALTIGGFLALAMANRLEEVPAYQSAIPDRFALAEYLGSVESGRSFGRLSGDAGVGTLGGSQDHTAILCAIPGELVQFGFAPVRLERRLLFPAGHCLVIGSSGVAAEKAGAARDSYNAAAHAVGDILQRWQAQTGRSDSSLGAVLAGVPDGRARLTALLAAAPEPLRARFEQFVMESEELVPQAADALARGDLAGFGSLVDGSQRGAERGLGNQIPETISLARSARRLGAVAASAFGAGFGGSVWAMVPVEQAAEFIRDWQREYVANFPERAGAAQFFTTRPGPSATLF